MIVCLYGQLGWALDHLEDTPLCGSEVYLERCNEGERIDFDWVELSYRLEPQT